MRCLIENAYGGESPRPTAAGVTGARTIPYDSGRGQLCGYLEDSGLGYITLPNFITAAKVQMSSTQGDIPIRTMNDAWTLSGVNPSFGARTRLYNLVRVGTADSSGDQRVGLAEIPPEAYASVSTSVNYTLTDPAEGATASVPLYASGGNVMFSFPAFRAENHIFFTIPVLFPVPEGKKRNFTLTFANITRAHLRFLVPSGSWGISDGCIMDTAANFKLWQDDGFGICVRYDIPDLPSGSSTYESGLVTAWGANASYAMTLSWTIEDDTGDEEEEEEP